MSDILTIECEEGRKEGEACFLLSSGAVLPHFRRQFREYGSGGSGDDLIGAGDLRNQPVVQ